MIRTHFIRFTGVEYVAFILISTVSAALIIGQNGNKTGDVRILEEYVGNELGSMKDKGPLICEHFETSSCSKEDVTKCHENITCSGKDEFCFTSWTETDEDDNSTNGTGNIKQPTRYKVKKMGCIDTDQTVHTCEETCEQKTKLTQKHRHFYCCCTGNYCNSNFTYNPPKNTKTTTPSSSTKTRPKIEPPNDNSVIIIIAAVSITIFVAVCAALAYIVHKRKTSQRFGPLPHEERIGEGIGRGMPHNQIPLIPLRPIQLQEIKARGRFGAVWKGTMTCRDLESDNEVCKTVAVKIFPMQDKNSWQAEQEIYNLPRMDHDSILKFIQCERRGENLAMEYWLTTEFHDNGSLCDFLKAHMVSWEDLCKIARTMAAGLTHLHEEIPRSGTLDMKPAIAHRDFKSKNVLIKSDLTACLADFGLALIFEPGKSCGDTHGQVGTRRYMAPEVLEGAINFSRDAFLRIDMYACGLVLWELVSRCTATMSVTSTTSCSTNSQNLNTHNTLTANAGGGGNIITNPSGTNEYKLPFEAEVSNPTLEQMQDLVVTKKQRPILKPSWRMHPGINAICSTIEECWDNDAEARVSASCVMERIKSFQHLPNHQTNEDRIVPNSISPSFASSQSSNNNRRSSVISPTDQRMNALNDQQTAEVAAAVLNTSPPSPFATSRTINYNNASNQLRNVQQGCANQNTSEVTPLLYIQPPHTSNNNNIPITRALLNHGQNDEDSNIEEETEGTNIMSNVVA